MTASAPPLDRPEPGDPVRRALFSWVLVLLAVQTLGWLVGERASLLVRAIEQGEARVEAQASVANLSPDGVRKQIQLQQATRPFWLTLALLGDFAAEPLGLILRPLLVATLLATVAALAGRPNGFHAALLASSRLQGLWVVGPALSLALARLGSQRAGDTTLTLFLPPGPHSAWLWATLHQADLFALLGWFALAATAGHRHQAPLWTALLIIVPLAATEIVTRGAVAALLGAGMRLTLLPD